jgi:hypothetical protein
MCNSICNWYFEIHVKQFQETVNILKYLTLFHWNVCTQS